MMTIDEIIFKIENHGFLNLSPSIPKKDKNILMNMSRLLKTSQYITNNQANLAIKLLKENFEHLNFVGPELITVLKSPSWLKIPKNPEKIRKISIEADNRGVSNILIKATYAKELKKVINEIQKTAEGAVLPTVGIEHYVALTEKNLINVLNTLKKYNFEKSDEILSLYEKIKNINLEEVQKQFYFDQINEENFKKIFITDIGAGGLNDTLLLNDRKIKYQYTIDEKIENIDEDSLLAKIATRKNHIIFINSQKHAINEIALALLRLQRLPTLIFLDEYNPTASIDNLKLIKNTLDSLNFRGNVEVYFRFDNTGEGEKFNKLVAEYGYNKKLDEDNKISILSNGKIPKFFLNTDWYPKSVISFTNNLRNNKTSVYCNECDLIVYYTATQPVFGNVNAIL